MRRTVAMVVVASLLVVTSVAGLGMPTDGQSESNASTDDRDVDVSEGAPVDISLLRQIGPNVSTNESGASNASGWNDTAPDGTSPWANGTGIDWGFGNGSGFGGDGLEAALANVTNGTDSDGDGLPNAVENATGTDPFHSDTDGDGLEDGTEIELGTDPADADTDGDSLGDARELAGGTNPLSADTDHDGLTDRNELAAGTDPTVADSDDDGLDDGRERAVGTDPTDADTDGDRLLDGWEVAGETPAGVPLVDADPLAKDLYVQVDYADGVERSGPELAASLEAEFAAMPVDNPDDTTGIDLHVRRGGLNESVTFDGGNFWSLKDDYYGERLGPRAGVYHQVVVSEFDADTVGYGEVGGEFAVVAAGTDADTRRHVVVHELLHNVVGDVRGPGACRDREHYCDGGWLTPEITPGENEYLPEPLATQLEDRGFAST